MPEYRLFVSYFENNRQQFDTDNPTLIPWINRVVTSLGELIQAVQSHAGPGSRQTQKLISFLILITGRLLGSFGLSTGGRGASAMATLRPALDGALILGKLADDPDNGSILLSREANPHQFTRTFTGTHVISRSLHCSARIQAAMQYVDTMLNEIGPNCYLTPDGESIGFDTPGSSLANALSVIHLACILERDLRILFNAVARLKLQDTGALAEFEAEFCEVVRGLAADNKHQFDTLKNVGLWDL